MGGELGSIFRDIAIYNWRNLCTGMVNSQFVEGIVMRSIRDRILDLGSAVRNHKDVRVSLD